MRLGELTIAVDLGRKATKKKQASNKGPSLVARTPKIGTEKKIRASS